MPRYEFSKDDSNKFWEITLSGKSFTTTHGKIGAKGRSTTKQFASAAEAKKARDKLVAQKTKKGYELVPEQAAPTSASGKPGARYFELVDGTSNKFWEVMTEGSTLTTRYGKIGTTGQTKAKDLGSASAAKNERDKLSAQKTKKGYVERSAGGGELPAGVADARNPGLEAAIVADPDDQQAFAVFSDWLQEQGDPRGELISLQLANKDKKARAFLAEHAGYFLGPLAEHETVRDAGYNNTLPKLRTKAQEQQWEKTQTQAFLWRNGFIHRLRLSHDSYSDEEWEGQTADVLDAVLAHPSGRFVVEFAFASNGDPNDDDLQSLIDVLGKKSPATTRKITFGDNTDQISWHHTGNLKTLWKGVPNLRVLEIESGHFDVGKMLAPALERAVFITGGLSRTCGENIAKAVMPKIEHLEIYYGADNYGGNCTVEEVRPLLARTDLEHLKYLGLKNSEFANDIASALRGARVLETLETLDLSLGTMTDEGAEALVAAKDSLRHLECLDLTRNFLSKQGIKAVKGLCKKVITANQEGPDDWGDDELHYYVSVAE